jgi:hypothetical protein
MREQQNARALRPALLVVGTIFVFGVWLLMRIWPSGLAMATRPA